MISAKDASFVPERVFFPHHVKFPSDIPEKGINANHPGSTKFGAKDGRDIHDFSPHRV